MVDHEEVGVVPSLGVKLPAPGTVFAGHLVETMVGRGGMGVVYRARHSVLDRIVALKLIAPDLPLDAETHNRLLEEAATAARIEHPNVVPVHDAGESEGVAYMIMRYVDGTDLHTMVRERGPLEPAHAAGIVAQVGDALDTLHGAGFVHHDVKPRNVLISSDHHVYLSDFGLARRVANGPHATHTGHWAGTVDYVAAGADLRRANRRAHRRVRARRPAVLRPHRTPAI